MKLFLCSLGIGNKVALQTLFDKPLAEIRCGVIKNPMDLKDPDKRALSYALVDSGFSSMGISKVYIDLREYISSPEKLENLVQSLDMLWVTGGNVFYIRELFNKVGFEAVLTAAIGRGLVYGGDSAGALVICPTLRYLDAIDDISQISQVIYQGLNLIDFVPLPHWGNEKYQPKLGEIKEKLEKDGIKVVTFSDGQTIVINNDLIRIVG